MPRSAIIWTRSRELSLKARYHLTHRMMISWSKCRPLNRSCAELGSVIPAVIAGYRAFQQFAPEPTRAEKLRRQMEPLAESAPDLLEKFSDAVGKNPERSGFYVNLIIMARSLEGSG